MKSEAMAVSGHDPGRTILRVLLVLLAGLLAATLALPAGPLAGIAGAQEEPEEEEEEQAAPEGPAIKFLNPSDYGKRRVASDRDMEGHGYHIVAWVHDVPRDPRVVFEIESSAVGRRRLGRATREAADAFGLHWRIPDDFPAGNYTMRAALFEGTRQVADDEIEMEVRRSSNDPIGTRWPTVRIDYPTNGGRVGVYQPPGDNPWNFVIDFTFSSEIEGATFLYSLTAPGLEPEWHECGTSFVSPALIANEIQTPIISGGTTSPGSARHLCELDGEHDGREVTAVAAIAHDEPFPLGRSDDLNRDRGGDAHRVIPYRQLPVDVNLRVEGDEPGAEGPRQYEAGTCTNQIFAFVSDQLDRPVARANIDVHATGPEATEGRAALRFDVSTGASGTDANQPPDQNHQDETSARSCTAAATANTGAQGNHRDPSGADTRHIESTNGTNVDGRFRFRLFNDQPGGTQITAWADLDDDDMHCSLEPAAHMAIGWDQAPPEVQGHQPTQPSCDIPGRDEALRDLATRHPRAIGINFRRVGGHLEVRGRIRTQTGHGPCARNVPVRVQRRAGNQWQTLANVRTNQQRIYAARVADRAGRYRAVAPPVLVGSESEHLCQRAVAARRR